MKQIDIHGVTLLVLVACLPLGLVLLTVVAIVRDGSAIPALIDLIKQVLIVVAPSSAVFGSVLGFAHYAYGTPGAGQSSDSSSQSSASSGNAAPLESEPAAGA